MKKLLTGMVMIATIMFFSISSMAGMTAISDSEMEGITGQLSVDIGIAAGDLDVTADFPIGLEVLGLSLLGADANIALTNGVAGVDPGQSISVDLMTGSGLLDMTADLSGIALSADLDAGAMIGLVGLNGGADINVNRLVVTATAGL